MFESIMKFFKKLVKTEKQQSYSKDTAKERLHLVLMQDRANVSADFLEMMKQEIIEVIKKYIDVDENAIDVRLTNKTNEDGTNGAPALYANIPIISIKEETKKIENKETSKKEEEKVNEEAKKIVEQETKKIEEENSNDNNENENSEKKEESNNEIEKKEESPAEQQLNENEKKEDVEENK